MEGDGAGATEVTGMSFGEIESLAVEHGSDMLLLLRFRHWGTS